MDTEIDWQRELDASFGSAPDVPAGTYVASGRRAVRRRRIAAVVAAATVVVAGGTAWASGPGTAPRGDGPVATQPPSPDTDDRAVTPERARLLARMRDMARSESVRLDNPAALTQEGELVLAPGAGPVLEQVPNPMGYSKEQGHSLGVRVMEDGKEKYGLLLVFPGSSSALWVWRTGDFDGWLAQAVRDQSALDVLNGVTPSGGDTSDMPWLALDADGDVVTARPGVTIVELRTDVDLGGTFGMGVTSAGVVRLVVDGRSEFAAYAVRGGQISVEPGGGTFESMDAFIDWASAQYASGDGLR